jgi:hypothetical protein
MEVLPMTTTKPLPEDEEKDASESSDFPELAADDQDTGEILLPGTREYAELVGRLKRGEIS